MRPLDILRAGTDALSAHRLRAALTAFGIAVGVAAVIAMVAVGKGARERILDTVNTMGVNVIAVWNGSARVAGAHAGTGMRPRLVYDDAEPIRAIPGVERVAVSLRANQQVVAGPRNWNAVVQGATPEWLEIRRWGHTDGRLFTEAEHAAGAKVVLLGASVAQRLFPNEDPIGKPVRIRQTPFEVIGVMERKGQSIDGADQDDIVFVPFWAARRSLFGADGGHARLIGSLVIQAAETTDRAVVVEEIRQILRARMRVPRDGADPFVVFDVTAAAAARDEAAEMLGSFLAAVALVALFVGGIGVMNVMLVSVTERTREIGLRMAIGARPRHVLAQFVVEASLLALIGGAAGVLLGVASAAALSAMAGFPVVLDPAAGLLALGVSAAVGLAAGLYPAIRASRLDPVVALREA
ncbi:ABC transporter permease [Elioraea rosea]|uniref:ABC transporter permease n=1 Tax=Elioraea rosea TaxID=2492390 RepID=UPI0011851653|nr:ABC transporter permease [Elioraea rosea]